MKGRPTGRALTAGLALPLVVLIAGCGGGGAAPTAQVQATVVKGPVVDGRLCAYRIDAAGTVSLEASDCERLDAAGRATLGLPESAQFLLVASGLRYRDESAAGALALLDGTLESIVTTAAVGASKSVAVTPVTQVAVASLRERATALSGAAFEAMLDRVARALQLSGEQARAVPAFDAAGQPADRVAATIAAFADLGRDLGTGVSAQLTRFAREFAKVDVDDALIQFNRQLTDAAAPRLQVHPTLLEVAIYGFAGTSGPAAVVDSDRRCFAKARGLWRQPLTMQTDAANFSLCIDRVPAGARCDAAYLRTLDFSGVDTSWGAANNSAVVMLVGALHAFTDRTDAYRLDFADRCESFPTLEATLSGGKLYRPGFLAPFE